MRRLLLLVLVLPLAAKANPRALPFSYPTEVLPKGALEVEQFVDLTPVKSYDLSGIATWANRQVLTTELEFGLADRLELGLYFQFSDDPGAGTGEQPLRFDGIKQRLRWALAEPGEWPLEVTLYGEIAELRNEVELEGKVLLQKRFGPVQAVVNLWAERELYFAGRREWVLNPTAGATIELSPTVHLGLEYWMHAELADSGERAFNSEPHHYLGPALMLNFRRLWWSIAPYVRLDGLSRSTAVGDQFGRVWVRSVIGLDL